MPTPLLVLYHGGCTDGYAAAFIANLRHPAAELVPVVYGQDPRPIAEMVEGRDVLVVDFSWDREVVEEMKRRAKTFRIFDHHKSAQKELAGLDYATFDMERSGAGLAWDLLFPDLPRPWWVDYVEDRDLWRFKLPHAREIHAYIAAQPHTLDAWLSMIDRGVGRAAECGAAIRQHIDSYVERMCQQAVCTMFYGYRTVMVNAPYMNISDVLHTLQQRDEWAQIALGWFVRGDGMVQFSLRSLEDRDDIDVSEIAACFGGGGHKRTAGFELVLVAGMSVIKALMDQNIEGKRS